MNDDDLPPMPPEPALPRPTWRQYVLGVLMIFAMATIAYLILRARHGA
ncbi:MAG TPA: hypothetical protein VFJ74_08345 [Gemmatimonadaceae bacterium]|jgi:hypothetical protein|nr:hypothetical protein [Gemmatimonadaceae bacterium]